MSRTIKNPNLQNRTQRAKLPALKNGEAHWHRIAEGQHLGYCKASNGQGTWRARYYTKEHGRRFQALGTADDSVIATGDGVLSFDQAVKAAQQWIDEVVARDAAKLKRDEALARGEELPEEDSAEPYLVAQALDDYLAEKEREKRKELPHTRATIESQIKPKLGHIHIDKLTHAKVKAWRDALVDSGPRQRTGFVKEKVVVKTLVRGEYKDRVKERATAASLPQAFREIDTDDPDVLRKRQATVNRILTVLKAALNHAHENRKITSKEAWEAVKPFRKVDVPKVRFLATDEVKTLIPACESEFRKLVKGALLTGCRYGELTSMAVRDFHETESRVYIAESKNGESRYVDLNDEGVAFFTELTEGRNEDEVIFLRTENKPWKTSEQKRPMDQACEVGGIDGVTFHILRHTYASHAVMNGMPIAVLSEQLGHKDTRITERHYAHLCKSFKRESVRANAPSFGFGDSKPGPVHTPDASEGRAGRVVVIRAS
jgi:integrase